MIGKWVCVYVGRKLSSLFIAHGPVVCVGSGNDATSKYSLQTENLTRCAFKVIRIITIEHICGNNEMQKLGNLGVER